jgi:cell division septal protein FtsQ
LFFYSGIQIKNITVTGNQKISTQDIKKIVTDNLPKNIFKFGPIDIYSKSIFFINSEKIDKTVLADFPIIESVEMDKNFPQTLIIKISERKPIALYCSNDGKCFLIDQNGIIFEPASTDKPYLIVRQNLNSDKSIFTGENVINQKIIGTIEKIKKDLKDNFNIDVNEAMISTPIRLNIKTSENWQIYFDTGDDSNIDTQITKLNLLLNGDINSDLRKKLKYIDLRFTNRAYYK